MSVRWCITALWRGEVLRPVSIRPPDRSDLYRYTNSQTATTTRTWLQSHVGHFLNMLMNRSFSSRLRNGTKEVVLGMLKYVLVDISTKFVTPCTLTFNCILFYVDVIISICTHSHLMLYSFSWSVLQKALYDLSAKL